MSGKVVLFLDDGNNLLEIDHSLIGVVVGHEPVSRVSRFKPAFLLLRYIPIKRS